MRAIEKGFNILILDETISLESLLEQGLVSEDREISCPKIEKYINELYIKVNMHDTNQIVFLDYLNLKNIITRYSSIDHIIENLLDFCKELEKSDSIVVLCIPRNEIGFKSINFVANTIIEIGKSANFIRKSRKYGIYTEIELNDIFNGEIEEETKYSLLSNSGNPCELILGNKTEFINLEPIRNIQRYTHHIAIFDYYSSLVSKSLIPMSDSWKETIADKWWFQKEEKLYIDHRLYKLRNRLLEFGGDAVCLPDEEPDIENILKFGQLWFGKNSIQIDGEPSSCHTNVCRVWKSENLNPSINDKLYICTGYALSADSMWRSHSWLMKKDHSGRNVILETTEPRLYYYGYIMPDQDAEEFCNRVFSRGL